MIGLLSPLSLLTLTWCLSGGIAWIALAMPDTFDLLPLFMARSGITLDRFGLLGGLWLVIAMLSALAGSLSAQLVSTPRAAFRIGVAPDLVVHRAERLTRVFVAITLVWILLSVPKAGGPGHFLHLAQEEPAILRSILLDNTLFPGMRLSYGALPALACLATALIASGSLSRQGRRRAWRIILLSAFCLLVLPIVLSQRILLMQFLISSWLAWSLAKGRLRAVFLIPLLATLFCGIWVLREALTNPTLSDPVLTIAGQKLAFYFVNDLWNSFAPFETDIPHTLGGVSFRGPVILMGLDGVYDATFPAQIDALEEARGGGEFSLFSGPYVDFGPFGGALFLAFAFFLARIAYHRARESLLGAILYAQIGAALLFSPHGNYLLHQNLIFGTLCILWVYRSGRRIRTCPPTMESAHGAA
ncbi:oligosaccharide repeat unit polymerase [Roseivivax sp. THAF197b]|uniref:oligosaccharide repeat unit polymerase n=1 Tax=Roseivivax sp. THAF197b TaxID=2588299 RepID=UPI0012A9BBA8|nr:oligosaccharide repeat unit polymerase [Roseivivax sp. THAF197b]QFS84995.1 hypothetical protein FIV09_19290 [Roseivivax sp. THAF197b]